MNSLPVELVTTSFGEISAVAAETAPLVVTVQLLASPASPSASPSVVAWGEIGLDFNRMYSPKKVQERIFEPFFTTNPEGTGLGLYLCKELCESNGADISYRRTADGRSSFRLSMRLQREDAR